MGFTSVGLAVTHPVQPDRRSADEAHNLTSEELSSEMQKNAMVISSQRET